MDAENGYLITWLVDVVRQHVHADAMETEKKRRKSFREAVLFYLDQLIILQNSYKLPGKMLSTLSWKGTCLNYIPPT